MPQLLSLMNIHSTYQIQDGYIHTDTDVNTDFIFQDSIQPC